MIGGRYWRIDTRLCIRPIYHESTLAQAADGVRAGLYRVGAVAGLSFLVVTDINAFSVARAYTAEKPIWAAMPLRRPLYAGVGSCVHLVGLCPCLCISCTCSRGLFSSADAPETAWNDASESTCPILGWAEHVFYRGNERLKNDTATPDKDLGAPVTGHLSS